MGNDLFVLINPVEVLSKVSSYINYSESRSIIYTFSSSKGEPPPWGRVLEKRIIAQVVKKFLAFCETRRFITVFTRAPYPEPAESSPHLPTLFLKFRCNIIPPSTRWSS